MALQAPKGASLLQKIGYQWKRGWHEIPEVMGSFGFFIVGGIGVLAVSYNQYYTENKTKQFKSKYTIMRPDDPRAKWLKRNELSPPITRTPVTKFC